ncbi:MAG: DUF4097 domain-containing protein [Gemmatimonadetes bacterium]|nr:DUF4097 domain-containing protein [Gemmatimonadota bacterium]MYG86360.1 DUF4097 domain-containing protein [Gemmatimonadota bacterium]MYJ91204.1 DUF4097 domain-containing protein [Gemmatimonadota bacterium]
MNRNGVVAVLCAFLWTSSACSTQEFGFEREGRDYIEGDQERFEVNPGGTLTVDAELGAIYIRSSNNDEVDVLVRKRLRSTDADQARKAFSNVEIDIKQVDKGVRIEVDQIRNVTYRRWFWQDWPDRLSVDIEVTVPVEYNLDLSTISGDIRTTNTVGDVTAKTLSGNISTGPAEGNLSIKTNSGNIRTGPVVGKVHTITLSGYNEIGPVNGEVKVRSNSGNIKTGSVEGNVQGKSLSGNIVIGPVHGDVTVSTNSGSIESSFVDGNLKASSLSGSVKTGPVKNDVTVSTTDGDIDTGDIGGSVQSSSLSGHISIGAVNSNVKANTTSGNIKVSNVFGVSETRSLSGDIRLGSTHGGIVASTASGDIEGDLIDTDSSVDARYQFQSLAGDISIILPFDMPAVIDAQISIGEIIDPWLPNSWHVLRHIDSDFDLDVSKVESSPGNHTIKAVGEINGGGNDIILVTNDGKIRIRSKDDW